MKHYLIVFVVFFSFIMLFPNYIAKAENPFLFPFYFYYIDAISDDHPCLVSYGAEFENGSDGHGIIAVGYTQTTVDRYLTVADGWNPFLRYITFDGYDYDYFRGFEVTVTS